MNVLSDPQSDPPELPAPRPYRRESMVVSTAKIATAGLVSRLTGFLRDVIIAGTFGATSLLDAYFVAASIPGIFQTSAGTILRTSFISVYSRLLGRGRTEKAARLSSLALVLAMSFAAVMGVLIVALAEFFVAMVAPGLPDETARVAAAMLRVLSPLAIIWLAEAWATSALNSHGVFGLPEVVGTPVNLIRIAFVLLLAQSYDVWGLVWGTITASLLAAVWLFTAAHRLARLRLPSLTQDRAELNTIMGLAWPIMLGGFARRLNVIVDQILASGIGAGSISALTFGSRLVAVPVGLLGGTVSTVIYPTLARQGERGAFDLVQHAWVAATLVLAPFVGFLIYFRVAVVDLVFGHGSFGPEAVQATALATAFYAPAILAWGLQPISSRAFYALGDSRTPMKMAVIGLAVNAAVSIIATPFFQIAGIALGTTVGSMLGALLVSARLATSLGRRPDPAFWRSLLKVLGAAAAAMLPAWAVLRPLGLVGVTGHLGEALAVAAFSAVYFPIYAGLVFAFRVPEALAAWKALSEKLASLRRRDR